MVQDISQVEAVAVVLVGKDLEEMVVEEMLLLVLGLEVVELQILEAVVQEAVGLIVVEEPMVELVVAV